MSATSTAGFYIVLGIILFFVGLTIYDLIKIKAPGLLKKKDQTPLRKPENPDNKGGDYL